MKEYKFKYELLLGKIINQFGLDVAAELAKEVNKAYERVVEVTEEYSK